MIEAIDLARATLPRERRQQPRVHANGRVELRPLGSDRRLAAHLVDLSVGGIRLRCTREEALAFLASPGIDGADRIRGNWQMSLTDRQLELTAAARRCYLQKAGEDELALGFEFTDLDEPSRRRLEDWVLSHMEPA